MDASLKGGAVLATGTQQSTINYAEIRGSYERNSNWWTVFACFDLQQIERTAVGIARRTGLPLAEVEEALSGLCVLGFLTRRGDSFEPVEGADFHHLDFSNMSNDEKVDRHGLVSQQILNELPDRRDVTFDHRCFAANDEILKELYKDMRAAFEKAFAKAQTSQRCDRIFKMTFTAVDVLSKAAPQETSL
jgi:hypothetical protein